MLYCLTVGSRVFDMLSNSLGADRESFAAYESSWIERPIMARFEMIAGLFSAKTAIDDGSYRLTYSELQLAIHNLAGRIEEISAAGEPIVISLPNGALLSCAILACL